MIHPFVRTSIVLITLLAVAMGGSVYLPAETILAGLAGLMLLLAPPRGPLPRVPLILAAVLLLLSLIAFLPSSGFGTPAWKVYLTEQCHLPSSVGYPVSSAGFAFPLSHSYSPQPWLTLQACALLFLGLSWALYLIALPWDRQDRLFAMELLVFGIALLSLLSALAFVLHFHIPGWIQTENRGWFPNRNQTADVLAVTAVAAYALIFDRLRKRKRSGYLLLLALAPIALELVISYSRAGILLFFGGVLAWHLWPRKTAGRPRGASVKWLALSAALGVLMLASFLVWGGDTLNRFLNPAPADALTQDITDFRAAIQRDALFFSFESPMAGTGLGNFEPLFSFSRVASINNNRAIHPESDWLWIASELGWPAVFVLLGGCIWWIRSTLPLDNAAGESMRRGLIVAGIVFLLHGLVDVSGHRLGSLWVGLLVAAMALPPREAFFPTRFTPLFFRGLGVLLLALAAWWGASLRGLKVPPTTGTLAQLQGELATGRLNPQQSIAVASAALQIAPLNWELYLQRGTAEFADSAVSPAGQADYATARALNPFWIALPLEEGRILSSFGEPDLAVDAYRDGLRRAGPLAHEEFRQLLGLVHEHSIERQGLSLIAYDNLDFLLLLLPTATLDEANGLLDHLLQQDPDLRSLTLEQRSELFASWWTQGDQLRLMELIHEHPEWGPSTWLYEAKFAARQNDFQKACSIVLRNVQPPIIPDSPSIESINNQVDEFASHPTDLALGLSLLVRQAKESPPKDALLTISKIVALPDYPKYVHYLGAQLFGKEGEWQKSWQAWEFYFEP